MTCALGHWYRDEMRGKARWGLLGIFVLMTGLVGCGGDDDTSTRDGGTDAGSTGGRGGAAGADSGRADTNSGGGGSGGTGDATIDRGIDGSGGIDAAGGRDGGPDVAPDRGPALDVSVEPDAGPIVDSAVDPVDSDDTGALDAETDAPPPDVAGDAPPAADVVSNDVAGDADASAGDADDAGDAPSGDAPSGDGSDAPLCDDGNAASFDFYHPTYGCGHKFDANPNDNDAWITYDAGFHVDVATGLGWALLAGSRNAPAAVAACLAHSVAGLGDWRIATIDDARSIAGGCAPTAAGGSCTIDDPGCLATACGQASPACDSCTGGQGPNNGAYCKIDVAVCTHFHTSSLCTDCGDASVMDWIYGTSNGNFLPFNSLSGIPTACVSAVPGGVPPNDGG